jgi:hypothetical protein
MQANQCVKVENVGSQFLSLRQSLWTTPAPISESAMWSSCVTSSTYRIHVELTRRAPRPLAHFAKAPLEEIDCDFERGRESATVSV